MTARIQALLGAALLLIGALKALSHLTAASTLTIPGCLGGNFIVQLDTPLWHQIHCWGCYVALLGLGLMLHTALQLAQKQRSGQRLRLD